MLPGFLARTVELLRGREHSLHLKAAGGAMLALLVVNI